MRKGLIKEVVAMKLRDGHPVAMSAGEYVGVRSEKETVLVYDRKVHEVFVRELTREECKHPTHPLQQFERLNSTGFLSSTIVSNRAPLTQLFPN